MALGSRREEREEARMLMVLRGQWSVTDSRAEGKMGAHEVRVGSFRRSLECQAQRGGFGHVGNGETAKAFEGGCDR